MITQQNSKLRKSQMGPNPQWRYDNWEGQGTETVPVKFLPPSRNFHSENVPWVLTSKEMQEKTLQSQE